MKFQRSGRGRLWNAVRKSRSEREQICRPRIISKRESSAFEQVPPSKHRMKNISTNIENQECAVTETPKLVSMGIGRRSFMRSLGVASSVLLPAAALCGTASAKHENRLHRGDVAILRFLAVAELIETDLWQQYTELALGNPAYGEALGVLDEDMNQYISD